MFYAKYIIELHRSEILISEYLIFRFFERVFWYNKLMAELLEIYDLDNKLVGVEERKVFYEQVRKEYEETGKITRKVKTIRVLVMNSEGRIYLQKRSNWKQENAGLYDKTVGGHISKGESPITTVVRECAEELGFPVVVLPDEDFESAVRSTDLGIIGMLRKVGEDPEFTSRRKVENGEIMHLSFTYFYIGYYDGAIKFKDGESSGLETFSYDELSKELGDDPKKFTHDLHLMAKKFEKYLKPLSK